MLPVYTFEARSDDCCVLVPAKRAGASQSMPDGPPMGKAASSQMLPNPQMAIQVQWEKNASAAG